MLEAFKKQISDNFSFIHEKKLLLTVSGGVDSVVLMHLMKAIEVDFSVAHCNFQLRGDESEGDHLFVQELAASMQVPFFDKRFETETFASAHKLSIQMAARKLRYEWFDELMKQHGFDYMVTGHHADDNLETFLINVIRGTGLEGLQGIPESKNRRLRPLLPFKREEIMAFAEEQNITWRDDSSNGSTKYLRNKLRHDVIPVLKELNLNLLDSFQETINHIKESQDIVDYSVSQVREEVVEKQSDCIKIDLKKLEKYPNPKAYLYPLLKPYGFTSWNDIHDLVNAQSGKQIFSDQSHIIKDRDSFLIRPRLDVTEKETVPFELEDGSIERPVKLSWEQVEKTKKPSQKELFVDADKLQGLTIRKWKEGDLIYPLGMEGRKKKLSKFFKDEKLSLFDKEAIWLLCSDDAIVWVIGKRGDHRFRVDKKTTKILKFTLNGDD